MTGTRINGHVKHCAEAVVTPVDDCKCGCSGAFHGGPHTWRARALVTVDSDLETRRAYTQTQVRRARRKARNAKDHERSVKGTDLLVSLAIEKLLLLGDIDDAKRVEEGIKTLVAPFADTIAKATLEPDERARIKDLVSELHLLCTLCALILETEEAIGNLVDDAMDALVGQVVDGVLTAINADGLPQPIKRALKSALRHAAKKFLPWALDPANKKALQLLGILFCPDTSHHPEIVNLCIVPLEREFLTSVLVRWAEENYPFDKAVLTNAS